MTSTASRLCLVLGVIVLVPSVAAAQPFRAPAARCAKVPALPTGASTFSFANWGGPSLPVYSYRPARAGPEAPIVFVMHGVRRDGDRYRDEWLPLAEKHGFILAVPNFSGKDFPESEGYNLGNLFDQQGAAVPRPRWSFAAIEPLFDDVKCRVSGRQAGYALYGHSAGGQFVHRYVSFMPAPRLTAAVSANSGWYTMPAAQAFPYGWGGKAAGLADPRALARPMTILLGTEDIDRSDANLRRTEEADAQGLTRFARGHSYLGAARAEAKRLGLPLNWRVAYAPGVGHDNGGMAVAAVPFLLPAAAAPTNSAATTARARDAVAKVAANKAVAAAMADILALERTWAIERMTTLTQIPAPPFGEKPRAEAFAQMLREIGGTEVSIDQLGNVFARRKGHGRGKGPTVMIAAHLDTVFPAGTDVTVRRAGDTFSAPGIGDNSRGLVVLLMLAEVMKRQNIATVGDVLFVGTVGEEGAGDLRGMRHIFAKPDHGIDRVIAIDGGDMARLVTQAVGSHRYRVRFTGPGGHSYGAFGTANPHHASARAMSDFLDRAGPVATSGVKATYSVAQLSGGIGINVIPTESLFEIDMRSADRGRLDTLDAILRSAVARGLAVENAARTSGSALTAEFVDLGKRPAGSNPAGATIVANAESALTSLGLVPKFEASSTDANLPMSLGIPSVTLSRGGLNPRSHSLQEQWIARDAHLGPQAALLLTLAEAGLRGP